MKKKTVLLFVLILIAALFVGCEKNDEISPAESETATDKNGEVYVLFTSDVHCGIDQGFGYVGLQQIRDSLEAQGYTTLLVDDGDAIQGETIGTLTKGEAVIDLMNALKYDVAIPGNHEFDYGMERFLELADKADFPYICCNFTYKDKLVFEPYVIKECAGMKIGFVGVTTPRSIASSAPAYFQDENGEFVYGFMQDETGEKLYGAVQSAVDEVRGKGVDLVYLLGHTGMEADCEPWTYADIISNTSGIDAFLDGHSHDTEQIAMKNKNGETVVRSACGTKMNCIGYSRISADKKIKETNIWKWSNDLSAPKLLGLENGASCAVETALQKVKDQIEQKVAMSDASLTIYDRVAEDRTGDPVRMVRRAETNLGDFCADAYRSVTGADIAVMNGGGVRADIAKGEISYNDIIKVHPFGNEICVIKATGQQIVDALEWGAHAIPGEFGGFLQVSGIRFEIDLSVSSGCASDSSGMFAGVEGERRVKNVFVGDEPILLDKYYTVAGTNYTLLNKGDGHTAFEGAELITKCVKLDNQALIDYITETLQGKIGATYSDPRGQGRIVIKEAAE